MSRRARLYALSVDIEDDFTGVDVLEAGLDLFDRRSPSRCDRVHRCASRLSDGATTRRHDVFTSRLSARLTKGTKLSKPTKSGLNIGGFRADGDGGLRPPLPRVRTGRITSREEKRTAACDPTGPHSRHHAKRGAVSGCSPSKRLTKPFFVCFVCLVFFVK